MLLDFVSHLCYVSHQPRSSRGVSGDSPVGGARRGVPRLEACNLGPGRPGTPPARHYDLAARSSLYGAGGNAGDHKRGPRPKIATVERREARVLPLEGARRLASAWRAAQQRVLNALRHAAGAAAPERRLGAPPPLVGVDEGKVQTPGATRRGNEKVCEWRTANRGQQVFLFAICGLFDIVKTWIVTL